MSLNLASLNQRYNYLLNLVNSIITGITPVPTSSPLSTVLTNGNSAGTNDIDMNDNKLLQCSEITSSNGLIEMLSDTNNIEMRVGDNVDGSALVLTSESGLAKIETSDRLRLTSDGMTIISTDFLELDCQSGITAKGPNITLTNINGGGAIIFLDDVVDNIQMSVEASAGNTGLFTNDNLLFQCENMGVLVRQGNVNMDSDDTRLLLNLAESTNGSALTFIAEDPSAIIESNNNLTIRSSSNLILQTPQNIQVQCPFGYITHQSGKMARTEEIRETIGSYLEPNANFFTTNNQNVRLYRVDTYFNPLTPKKDGWYCYLFSYDGGVDLTSDDGKTIIGRRSGPNTTYPISGNSTQRISLVYVASLQDYVWSVSDF